MLNIEICLAEYPVGRTLDVSCLDATISFVNILSGYISDTHGRLTAHGYSDDLSWQLVTQVVYHVFARDLDSARNFVRDGSNTSNPELLHGSVLWGIFRTHHAMAKYMRHGFGSHPAVAAQYLSFLVDSRGKDSEGNDAKLSKVLSKVDNKIEQVEKIAKEARSAASSASNGLDQLNTKVNNLNRNGRNNGGGNNDN